MQLELFPQFPDRFTVYLVRHATPDRTRFDLPYYMPPGPDLTEKGRREAHQLGDFLRDAEITSIYASPLERAYQTASIVGGQVNVPVIINADLAEWRPDESEKVVQARARRALEHAAIHSAQNGPVALISHGGLILTLLRALGLPFEVIERSRIYDSRNLVPMAGAWLLNKNGSDLEIRLIYVPAGAQVPSKDANGPIVSS